jgi:hypothetical protein
MQLKLGLVAYPYAVSPLVTKQKAAVSILASKKYNGHTEPLFKDPAILPLSDLSLF